MRVSRAYLGKILVQSSQAAGVEKSDPPLSSAGLLDVSVQPRDVDIPGLFKFEAETGKFTLTLHDKGVPYGEVESRKMLATTEFTIPKEQVSARIRLVGVCNSTLTRSSNTKSAATSMRIS